MTELPTTSVRLLYLFDDGRRGDLGEGEIDAEGRITMIRVPPDQQAYLDEVVGELNARDDVILKEPPSDPDAPMFAVQKRKVRRDADEFLSALKAYAARIYAIELDFSEQALRADEAAPPDDAPRKPRREP
jgi:hypothetical protein